VENYKEKSSMRKRKRKKKRVYVGYAMRGGIARRGAPESLSLQAHETPN
jgi:hypothetical protein